MVLREETELHQSSKYLFSADVPRAVIGQQETLVPVTNLFIIWLSRGGLT